MNKRRRTSSVASRGTEDDGDDIPPEPTKRRKKLDPVSVFICIIVLATGFVSRVDLPILVLMLII